MKVLKFLFYLFGTIIGGVSIGLLGFMIFDPAGWFNWQQEMLAKAFTKW